jgi:hypothetical protein
MKHFLIFFSVALLFWVILPNYVVMESDSGDYFKTAHDLHDTTWRTLFYPLIIRILNYNYELITLFGAFVAAGCFYFVYLLSKNPVTVILMALFGVYLLYIPYVMTDLLFGFFMIGAYYFLREKKLIWHFVMLTGAVITRPSLAWWFLIEPILVYLVYRDRKTALWSLLICFLICQINPLKNLIDNGRYIHSIGLGINLNDFLTSTNKLSYIATSLKSHLFPTHWNVFFETIGLYKRDIWVHGHLLQKSFGVFLLNYLFYFLYFVLYARFIVNSILKKDYFNLLWIDYFVGQSLIVHTMASRMRLPWEFILFLW